MNLSLPANISKLRKERSMTQEQLAESLGVTFAAVSKWERGVATPELGLIAELANLFGVSLDALVGFDVQDGGVTALEERIHNLQREKKYKEAITEAEKALLRYPNDFRIVYRSGELYAVAGIEKNESKYINRCIGLLEHAILLLSQNTDPKISEVSIQNEIAQCYIVLGKHEKGLEILKKYNVCGVHDALIAMICASEHGCNPKDVEPYMRGAFGNILTSSVRTMMAYANYYFNMEDYISSRESLIWLINMLESIKIDPDAVAYVDKVIAPCYSECANLSFLIGEEEKVESYLRRACQIATTFDATPTFKFSNIKFCVGDIDNATAYDDLGESAIASVEKQITQENRSEILYRTWKKIIAEETYGGVE
ncbi:MAG: helix-turn-helix transcriptional regulator [Lachnospiraceae bacterium]|nr:helix-turn-helix transcriptional regulator [Lachnospiraceae bacterium]